jgi:uncharacterized membrane protein
MSILSTEPTAHTAMPSRILSLDVMRGVVMVLMAIDHVRVFSGIPAGGPSAGVFFTRWVTHFCAPGFVFLAGAAAFLHGRRLQDRGALARYLVTRGLLLVLLELTLIRVEWTFNVDFAHYILAGVIWMLGWCMILLAALIRLPAPAIGAFGLVVIFGQNVMALIARSMPQAMQDSWGWLWQLLYFGGWIKLGQSGPILAVLYSIVPWIGVMAAGYAFGAIVIGESSRRDRLCVAIGCSAIALFLLLRGLDIGDPHHWRQVTGAAPPAIFRFLNTNKYPASAPFLLMTLGPLIALLPLAERARGRVGSFFALFGRVPLFYYLLHIPLIHAAALVVSYLREGHVDAWLFANHPMMPPPPPVGYTWGLGLLYLVFLVVVALLFVACSWFAGVKARHREGWLRYL